MYWVTFESEKSVSPDESASASVFLWLGICDCSIAVQDQREELF